MKKCQRTSGWGFDSHYRFSDWTDDQGIHLDCRHAVSVSVAVFLLILFCGCKSWTVDLYRHDQFHMHCLRQIAHICWEDRIPNTEYYRSVVWLELRPCWCSIWLFSKLLVVFISHASRCVVSVWWFRCWPKDGSSSNEMCLGHCDWYSNRYPCTSHCEPIGLGEDNFRRTDSKSFRRLITKVIY